MTSERQIAANRANARQSTGPKTAAGRHVSSRNALKHGLSRPVDAVAVTATRDALARWLDSDCAAAQDVAHAHLELWRIRSVRDGLLIAVLAGGTPRDVRQLMALARYERPALARWNRALKRFADQEGEVGAEQTKRTQSTHDRIALPS